MNKTIFDFLTKKHELTYLESDDFVLEAIKKMSFNRYNVIPVLKDSKYYGSISEGDFLNLFRELNFNLDLVKLMKVENVKVYRPYLALDVNTPIEKILELSIDQNFIPLVDDRGMFIGIIKRKSILEYFLHKK